MMAGSLHYHLNMHKNEQLLHVRGPWIKGRYRAQTLAMRRLRARLQAMTNNEMVKWNRAGRPENVNHAIFAKVNERLA